MNRKIFLSLIIFLGVFFTFGMNVKAEDFDCTYYLKKSDGSPDLENVLKIEVYDFDADNDINYTIMASYSGTKLGEDAETDFLSNVDYDGKMKRQCPKDVKVTVIKDGQKWNPNAIGARKYVISLDTYNVTQSAVEEKYDFITESEDIEVPEEVINQDAIICKYVGGTEELPDYVWVRKIQNGNNTIFKVSSGLTDITSKVTNLSEFNFANCPTYFYKMRDLNYMFSDSEQSQGLRKYRYVNGDVEWTPDGSPFNYNGIGDGTDDVDVSCKGILGEDFINFLNDYIFTPLKIVAPILLLVFTTLDFAKAVFADDKDGLKKAQSNFVKRTIAVILLYLLTYILGLIFVVIDNRILSDCLDALK